MCVAPTAFAHGAKLAFVEAQTLRGQICSRVVGFGDTVGCMPGWVGQKMIKLVGDHAGHGAAEEGFAFHGGRDR